MSQIFKSMSETSLKGYERKLRMFGRERTNLNYSNISLSILIKDLNMKLDPALEIKLECSFDLKSSYHWQQTHDTKIKWQCCQRERNDRAVQHELLVSALFDWNWWIGFPFTMSKFLFWTFLDKPWQRSRSKYSNLIFWFCAHDYNHKDFDGWTKSVLSHYCTSKCKTDRKQAEHNRQQANTAIGW